MRKCSFGLVFTVFLLVVEGAWAYYFDDQGNIVGRFRTDYDSLTEGSSSNPLVIGSTCYYPSWSDPILIKVHPSQACPTGPTVYPGGPYPHSNVWPFPLSSYFVISGNVELSFSTTTLSGSIQGAPNLSSSLTGSPDLLHFYMTPFSLGQSSWYQAHLLVDNEGTSGAKFDEAIPFLSIGAQYGRGNASYVGKMNSLGIPKRTTWASKVNMATATGSDTNYHYVAAIATWGGKRRMLFVNLFHYNMDWSSSSSLGLHRHWNWRAKNSFYYPGADIAFIDAEDIVTHCGSGVGTVPRITSIGVTTYYSLDWEALYRCVSDGGLFDTAMPTTAVALLGVHWGNELFGDAAIWVIVEQMKMAL